MSGFYEEISATRYDKESFVVMEVTQEHKDTYGVDGDIRIATNNGYPDAQNVWLDRKTSKKLRKALKRAEKFLEA